LIIVQQIDLQAADDEETPVWMQVIGFVTLALFATESACRIYVHRGGVIFYPFYVLDIVVCVVDISAMILRLLDLDFIPMLSLLRFWRLLRLLDALLRMDQFRELHLMVSGFRAALKSLLWATFMIGFALIFCSIFAVQIIHPLNQKIAERGVYEGCDRCPKAFASIWQSTLTFIQQIITGDSWGLVTLPIIESYPLSALFFFPVFLLIDMALVNLVLMVVIDQVEDARMNDVNRLLQEKEKAMLSAKHALQNVCKEMDEDKSGNLTLQELKDGAANNPEFANLLDFMDIRVDDMDTVFSIMDVDESGTVSYDEFCDQLHKMKSDDAHTMLVLVRYQVKQMTGDVKKQLDYHRMELQLHREEMECLKQGFQNQFNEQRSILKEIGSVCGRKEEHPRQETFAGLSIAESQPSPTLPNNPGLIAQPLKDSTDPLSSQLFDVNRMDLELSQLKQWINEELTPILQDELVPVLQDVKIKLNTGLSPGSVGISSNWPSQKARPWLCGNCRPPRIRVSALSSEDASALQNVSKVQHSNGNSGQ